MSEYDTTAIRREANKLKSCYNQIDSAALDRVKKASGFVERDLRGGAADALAESLAQTAAQIKTLREDLRVTYQALFRFADALEEADEKAAKLMH